MMIFTLGFLAVALLAAIFGWSGLASGAAGMALLIFLFFFFAGSGMTLWQLGKKSSTPPTV